MKVDISARVDFRVCIHLNTPNTESRFSMIKTSLRFYISNENLYSVNMNIFTLFKE